MRLNDSKKRKWLTLAVLFFIFAQVLSSLSAPKPALAATQAEYYVSPNGNDADAGTIAAPFRTVEHARDVVRTVNANMTGDIYVYLRGGNYPVTSSIDFTPSDSGTNGYRIIYKAYSNETPILNGGVQVTGWTQHSGSIWKAPLSRNNKLRALYVNDKRAVMATKTVNTAGCYGEYKFNAGDAPWAWEDGAQCDGAKYSLADFPAIALNQDDLEIETRTTWTTAIVGARQVTTTPDGLNRLALFQQPGAAIAQGAFNGDFQTTGSHKLMNAYEFLDTPGEFYFDKTNQMLYYYKNASDDMTTATVFAPNNVETILSVKGTSTSSHVRNITFSGITIEHSDWNLVNIDGSVFKQAQQGNLGVKAYGIKNFHSYFYENVDTLPGIVQVENADGILLERNTVKHTGSDGINMVNDVTNSQLIGNYISDIAGSAMTVGHPQHIYIGDATDRPREKYPVNMEGVVKNIDITNNYIYDTAVLFNGSAAVSGYFTDTLNFQHNVVEKTPWAGISLGWGWYNFDGSSKSILIGTPTTTAKNNNISYNQFINTMQVLHDSAPIYTLGAQPTTTISNNYILGVPAGKTYGLHPDEGSAYINFQNNVLNVDPNLDWIINSGTWGNQHDVNITQTYGTINKIFNKNVPGGTIQDVNVYSDNVWPLPAYSVALNSGLEDAYRDVIPQSNYALQDYILPASVLFVDPNATTVSIRSAGDSTKTVWLAPAGKTSFAESSTMTKASGTATSITVPRATGDYKIYVLDAQGNRSAESRFLVRQQQQWINVDDKAASVSYSAGWSNWNDPRDFNGSESFVKSANSYAQYSFTGTGIRYIGMTQPNMGKVDVYIDGVLAQADLDAYAPSVTKQAVLYQRTDLVNGTHTIKVVCKGAKNASSSDTTCAVDAFASLPFPDTTATYKIVNKNSGKVLDVSGGNTSDNASIIQWTYGGATNQQWKFTKTASGNYKIVCQKSLKLIDVSTDGVSIVQMTDANVPSQQWQIIDAGNGYVKIMNQNSGKVLDVSSNGTSIIQSADTNANSQQWQLVKMN